MGTITTDDEKIVIDDEIEPSYVKIEDSDEGTLHVEESSEHMFISTFVKIDPNVTAKLVRYWKSEIKELVKTLRDDF